MNKDFNNLISEFRKIAKKKWIKSPYKGHGTIGLTLEKELGKKINSEYLPDYNGIEIKCTTRFSRFPISLFSVAFDGPTDKEIIRLNERYGNYDKDFPEKKTLIRKIRCKELSLLKNNYYLSLEIKEDKLFLCVYDKNKNLIEKESYLYIDTIKKHLNTKLKKLAIIKASKKKIYNIEYFRYYLITLYTLKNFDTFLKLLESGEIEITIISRINKTGITAGKYNNKNLVFQIKKSNIEKLFNKIYTYDYDKMENFEEIQFL